MNIRFVFGVLARIVAGCDHEGLMTPLRTLGHGVEIWRCESCLAELLFEDPSPVERFDLPSSLSTRLDRR
jgi:hypothetical protein